MPRREKPNTKPEARAVLQRVLRGRITFTARTDGQGYDFSGPTRFDRLFVGIYVDAPAWMRADADLRLSFGANETCETDYAQLLEAMFNNYNSVGTNGKGVASPTESEALQTPIDRWIAA